MLHGVHEVLILHPALVHEPLDMGGDKLLGVAPSSARASCRHTCFTPETIGFRFGEYGSDALPMATRTNDETQPPSLLTGAEVAALLRTNRETLRYWRHIKYGPPGIKVGRHVLYSKSEVQAWIAGLARSD
ncbi:helix-turn-helix transcriptional regulator [Knoellia sp. CPCC 206450]|uniref:helix-turn-helix transcriptional regulator n=1 Tax=Knoellia tibetensis TaxID=3404798 RepID=UPI003B43BAC6